VLALVLGLIISAGLYFAYLWPSVEPVEPVEPAGDDAALAAAGSPAAPAAIAEDTASPAP